MVKVVFFDFWGTLVENGTYSPLRQTYKMLRVRMPFGKFAEQFEKAFMTKSFGDSAAAFKAACEALDVECKPFILDKLIGMWNKNRLLAELYPDTIDTLKALKEKGYKIALVSNAPENNVEPLLERFEMTEFFDEVFLSYEHGVLKTGGLFDIALKKMKLKPGDVISCGDSIDTDIKGAEAAGITAVLIDRKERREHTLKIKALVELLPIVEE